jgi:hypothetical protein
MPANAPALTAVAAFKSLAAKPNCPFRQTKPKTDHAWPGVELYAHAVWSGLPLID